MSKLEALYELQAEKEKLEKKIAAMSAQVKDLEDLSKEVSVSANDKGIKLRDLALALCPELDPERVGRKAAATGTRQPRQLKTYKNPHNGEVVQTKGGNHKVLKGWKDKYGAEEVEKWLQK